MQLRLCLEFEAELCIMAIMNTKYLVMIEGIPFKGRCETINISKKPYNAVSGTLYHSKEQSEMTLICRNDDDNTTACVEMIKDAVWYGEELVVRLYKNEGGSWTYSRIEGLPIDYRPATNGMHIIEFVNVIELNN